MAEKEQKAAAKKFAEYWKDKGYEKGECQPFWLSLLRDVYGVAEPEKFISFEEQAHIDTHTGFIDGYIPATKVMIEQKGLGKDLRKGIRQSDGSMLNPFQQAKRYITELPVSRHPRWVVTCNFGEFLVYDMEKPNCEPEQIFLKDLSKEYYRLNFLTDTGDENVRKEMEVSLQAGELVGKLYNAILKQYKNPDSPESLKSLNMLCVRLVFCLYAEDAGIFGGHKIFHKYISEFDVKDVRRGLIDLFKILDTEVKRRDGYLEGTITGFPYVNGGLFADENIEIPNFNEEIVSLLLDNASRDFDWSAISPTIFGAVFESTLNPETRRSGGMHYTSVENIHKVIDPLFLDGLKKELEEIKEYKQAKTRNAKLLEFQDRLASLKFLDPACGSGNFLTETYISLRRLENEVIKMLYGEGLVLFEGLEHIVPIKVSIGQFYGIEINDFAVSVAKTALWIAESQMMRETEEIVHRDLDFLPLKSYANIVEGNALRLDWESVVPKNEVDFIMGNPPFVGARRMNSFQRNDMLSVFADLKNSSSLDYVTAWYEKAAKYIKNTNIQVGYVSTNSIAEGEQVAIIWKHLFELHGVIINFAYPTFLWENESNNCASVHCVIIGFSHCDTVQPKLIFGNGIEKKVNNINGYLVDAPNVWIEKRTSPLCDVPVISNGSKPLDKAICAFTPEEKISFIRKEPKAEKYFFRYMGSKEFINSIERWFLLINRIPINELRKMPEVMKKLEQVREYRLNSDSNETRKLADTPSKFHYENMPVGNYLVIPQTSSGRRKYIPIGFLTPDILVNNKLQVMRDGGLYELGILSSNVHNSWIRYVAGRLRNDFTYSVGIVYNNFPWCTPTEEQKQKIEQTAQEILDARAKYPDCSLADLYDELTMPKELRKAHQKNDLAVMQAYGFDRKMTESECVGELMKMYEELTGK